MDTATVKQAAEAPHGFVRAEAPPDRLGRRWANHLRSWLGLPPQRRFAYAALQVEKIRHWEK